MDVVEVKHIIEDWEGLGSAIDAKVLNPDELDDPILADKISDLYDLMEDVKEYISETIKDRLDVDNYDTVLPEWKLIVNNN